jgi:hypothetical protein
MKTHNFIQDGGSLSVDEALQKVKEREEIAFAPTSRRPPRCSICNKEGHNRRVCPAK